MVSQVMAKEIRGHRVQRLAGFFDGYRQALRQLPRLPRENPFIVVLTPGPANASYFEHAYLSSYLGLTLVQGADLAVRDHRVYLKTLGGLERVDVGPAAGRRRAVRSPQPAGGQRPRGGPG